jgi:hypothetical protein
MTAPPNPDHAVSRFIPEAVSFFGDDWRLGTRTNKKSSTTSCLGAMGSCQPRIWSFRTDPRPETTPVVGYGTDRFRVKEPPFGQSQCIANRFRFQRRNGCGGAPFSYGT